MRRNGKRKGDGNQEEISVPYVQMERSVLHYKECGGSRSCRKEACGNVMTELEKEHKHENQVPGKGRWRRVRLQFFP